MEDIRKHSILIVDDDKFSVKLITNILAHKYRVFAVDKGEAAVFCARNLKPNIILLDIRLAGIDGYEVCRRLKKDERTADIPVLFVTSMTDSSFQETGFQVGGADYIIKPFVPAILEARIKVHIGVSDSRKSLLLNNSILEARVRERSEEIEAAKEAAILSIAAVAELRNHETGRHLFGTKLYVRELALVLSTQNKYYRTLTDNVIDTISKSSVLHDIGKVGIPDSILMKRGKLTADEYEIIKTHTLLGKEAFDKSQQISGRTLFSRFASEIAYTHHEKWNGLGYPRGLKGEEIPLSGRLMAVADVYDALVSDRVYKSAFSHEEAEEIIMKDSGSHFDPEIADAFFKVRGRFAMISETTTRDYSPAKMVL